MKTFDQITVLNGISPSFKEKLAEHYISFYCSRAIEILQINITKRCNLKCKHCHVQASPKNEEMMSDDVLEKILDIVSCESIKIIDITGGAPEMHPRLEWFLMKLKKIGKQILVRTNLVIMTEPAYTHFPEVYTKNKVELIASLPYFEKVKYEKQRGDDIFDKSILVLKKLNELGYGKHKSGLKLDLVHNPTGAYMPADQKTMEYEYRKNLGEIYDITFNNLINIINMPIGRYLEYLIQTDNFNEYTQELIDAFNPKAVQTAMCNMTLSVAPDGSIYNCDFNQMLDIKASANGKSNLLEFECKDLNALDISLSNHCYGCTAGRGSGCHGETTCQQKE
jgi:radical SAM/Cys-rich protein